MDKQTAADSYSIVQTTFNDTGIPTREGIGNIIRAIKAEGRFTDRNIAFEEVAEPVRYRGGEGAGIQGAVRAEGCWWSRGLVE